jgi:hypothetical protein
MTIGAQRHSERSSAGEALQQYYIEARARSWKSSSGVIPVGQFTGFALAVSVPNRNFGDGPCFILKGRGTYSANHSEHPQGMVRVIENLANSLEERLAEAQKDLVRAAKRLADILAELAKPFDKEARLTQLLTRQREINAALDLDKGHAGAMEAEAEVA